MDEMLTHAVVCQLKHKMPLINRLVDPGPDFWSNSIPKLAFLKGRIRIQNSFFFKFINIYWKLYVKISLLFYTFYQFKFKMFITIILSGQLQFRLCWRVGPGAVFFFLLQWLYSNSDPGNLNPDPQHYLSKAQMRPLIIAIIW